MHFLKLRCPIFAEPLDEEDEGCESGVESRRKAVDLEDEKAFNDLLPVVEVIDLDDLEDGEVYEPEKWQPSTMSQTPSLSDIR